MRTLTRGRPAARAGNGRAKVGCSYPDRPLASIGQPDDHESRAAARTLVGKRKSLTKQRMPRVCDRDLRYEPIENDGIQRCSAIQLSVTRYWTASFTTLTASNSKATVCDAVPAKRKQHEPSRSQSPRPHHTPLPPTLTRRLFPGHHTIVSRARHRVDAQHANYQC